METTKIEEKQKLKKNPLRGLLKAGFAPAFVCLSAKRTAPQPTGRPRNHV
jgi:hypothetical protein